MDDFSKAGFGMDAESGWKAGFGIDAESIRRTVREALQGLEGLKALDGLEDELGGLHHVNLRGHGKPADQRFEVGSDAELVITTIKGAVIVRGSDTDAILLHASDAAHVDKRGNLVDVRAALGGSLDCEITVPHGCRVSVNTVEADVEVTDTRAAVQVHSVNGDVTIHGASDECRITTSNGDVTCEDLDGTVAVRTTNGDVDIISARLIGLELGTTNGDVTVDASLVPGRPSTIHTTDGDVDLRLAAGTGAEVSFDTTNGEVSCGLPVEVVTAARRSWRGRVNGGGAAIAVHSVNGDLTIEHGETPTFHEDTTSEGPAAVYTPEPTPSEDLAADQGRDDGTTDVLRALERGDLTVDQAMERLEDQPSKER